MSKQSVFKKRGFTLIELLVIISIIGFLTSVVSASLGSSRDKATAARIASELSSIQRAFHQTSVVNNLDFIWPIEGQNGLILDPSIPWMVENGFLNLPTSVIEPSGLGDEIYEYDNGLDAYVLPASCPNQPDFISTVVVIRNLDSDRDMRILERIDEIIDDGDGLTCGNIINASVSPVGLLVFNLN